MKKNYIFINSAGVMKKNYIFYKLCWGYEKKF